MLPDFAGGSIANLPASVLREFAPEDTLHPDIVQPLRSTMLPQGLLQGARVIILLVVDGAGQANVHLACRRGLMSWLDRPHFRSTITSVFPSTTVAAMTTLQTGLPPAVHGMAGYTMYLEQQQATVNVIGWKAAAGFQLAEPLPDPRSFLHVPNIYQRLESAGVESVVVSNKEFSDSALTNIQSAGVPYAGHRTMSEMAGLLLQEASRPGKRFIFGYWDGFDTLSHTHGPGSDICLNELYLLDKAIGRGLLGPLQSVSSGEVVVLVVADHGHIAIDQTHVHSLSGAMSGRSGNRPIPTGDRRASGLPFGDPIGRRILRDVAGDDGVVLDVREAVEHGLYGPGPAHPELLSRIGESLLLSTGAGAFVHQHLNNPTAGGHGSLTSQEMLVPLLCWRF